MRRFWGGGKSGCFVVGIGYGVLFVSIVVRVWRIEGLWGGK